MPKKYNENDEISQEVRVKPVYAEPSFSDKAGAMGKNVAGIAVEAFGSALNIIPGIGDKKTVRLHRRRNRFLTDEQAIVRGDYKIVKTNDVQRLGRRMQKDAKALQQKIVPIVDSGTDSLSSPRSLEDVSIVVKQTTNIQKLEKEMRKSPLKAVTIVPVDHISDISSLSSARSLEDVSIVVEQTTTRLTVTSNEFQKKDNTRRPISSVEIPNTALPNLKTKKDAIQR